MWTLSISVWRRQNKAMDCSRLLYVSFTFCANGVLDFNENFNFQHIIFNTTHFNTPTVGGGGRSKGPLDYLFTSTHLSEVRSHFSPIILSFFTHGTLPAKSSPPFKPCEMGRNDEAVRT